MDIQFCLASCEKMIQRGSSSFYRAFGYLPSPRREAVFVIYAFCRMIDDSVDDPHNSDYSLDQLEDAFIRLEQAEGHFIWPALRWLFDRFELNPASFLKQIEGQRRDLTLTHYTTMEQLEDYCYLVAGTVGEMLLPVLHPAPTEAVVRSGVHLGKAMQIVNIVRDIGEDRRRGRRYVPLLLMERYGYREEAFAKAKIDEPFRLVVRHMDQLARSWFELGMAELDSYPPDSAFSIELAARFYQEILQVVEANRYQVFKRRAVVGAMAKVRIYKEVKSKYSDVNGLLRTAASSR